jgi:hypothetical protein
MLTVLLKPAFIDSRFQLRGALLHNRCQVVGTIAKALRPLYGVISQTTPQPTPEGPSTHELVSPPPEVVPYKLPFPSNVTLLRGYLPSEPPVKSYRSVYVHASFEGLS